ncbi:BRCA2 [Mytilus edulis]|uniref:BRCA2 n=1 Tax=Mytilus edulis TaxID=6550 RepID=A0A8S3VDS1_MYTED|nr:BRCA2 [Mytilus edulis]
MCTRRKRQKMNTEFQKIWNDGDEKNQQRNVIPLMKVRLVGCCRKDTDSQMSSLLSIWRPTSTHNDLKKDTDIKFTVCHQHLHGKPYLLRYARSGSGGVQLTATKQTQFKPLALDDNILDMIYEPREVLTKQGIVRKRPTFKEADIVGIVIIVNNTNFEHSGKQQDIVYVADINDDFIGIKFWGGVKDKTEFLLQSKERLHDKLNARNSLASVNKSPQGQKSAPRYIDIQGRMIFADVYAIKKNSSEILIESKTPNNPKTTSKMAALLSYSSPSPISPIVLSSTKSIHKAFKPPSLTRK